MSFLVDTAWLEAHLRDPEVRVIDIRGSVPPLPAAGAPLPPSAGLGYSGAREDYLRGHIPGATYLDWTRDIVDLGDPVEVQIAKEPQFAAAMSSAGIGSHHIVVAYDDHPASTFATRLWWALRYYGHPRVVVLDGGLDKWTREHRPVETGAVTHGRTVFRTRVERSLRSTVDDVLAALHDERVTLVDARDAGQFSGDVVRGSKRRGHIPGAVNLPREELVDPQLGTFRSEEELRTLFSDAGLDPGKRLVCYCNGGVAAATLLFGLSLAGYTNLSNYDGSWNEWSDREDLPAERGNGRSRS